MIHVDALPAPVRVLIAAGREFLRGETISEHSVLTASDRAALPDFAMRHGMVAWLPAAAAIASDPGSDVASAEADVLRRHIARSLSGIRDLVDLVDRLRAAGIPVVALKGPAFSAWIYDNAAARRFNDLDLLVPERARAAALQLLESIGYARPIPPGAAEIIYHNIGAWPLSREGSTGVDLHWRLARRRFARVLTAEDVLRNAAPVRIGTHEIAAPGPTHAAVLNLTHAARHLWYSLELPLSIARLMHRPDVDWGEVRRLVAKGGAVRPAAAGLRIAAELFDAPVPAAFTNDVRAPAVEELCSCAAITLALPPYVFPDRRIDRRVHRLSFDRTTDRIAYDVRRVVEPTHADWAWLSLPPSLAAMYVPVRLVRLAGIGLKVWTG